MNVPFHSALIFILFLTTFTCGGQTPEDDAQKNAIAEFKDWYYGCKKEPSASAVRTTEKWLSNHPDDSEASFWVAKASQFHWTSSEMTEEKEIELLRKASNAHFPAAQAELGLRLVLGKFGVTQNIAEGHRILNEAMKANEPSAFGYAGRLAYIAAKEHASSDKLVLAESLLKTAVSGGAERFNWVHALALYDQGKEFEALAAVQRGAGLNEPRACLLLAQWYRNGIIVDRNEKEAFRLANISADTGDAEALRFVGDFYFTGFGVEQNDVQAFDFYKKAEAGGDNAAAVSLGECYLSGRGTPIDAERGRVLLEKMIARGIPDPALFLGKCYIDGLVFKRDLHKAQALIKIAADAHITGADIYLQWLKYAEEKRGAEKAK